MAEISIEELGLSKRSTNALNRANVFTTGQLVELKEDDLYHISNIGVKSVAEVQDMIEKLKNGEILISVDHTDGKKIRFMRADGEEDLNRPLDEQDLLVAWAHERKGLTLENVFFRKEGQTVEDLDLGELPLSVRACHALEKNGINKLSEVCCMTMRQLYKIKSMGKKSSDEILEVIKNYTRVDEAMAAFAANASLNEVVGCFKGAEYMEEFGTIKKHVKRSLASEGKERVSRYEANPKDHMPQLVAIVMKDVYFMNLFQVHTVNKIRKKKKTSKADFSSVFPGEFSKFKAEVLQDMVDKKEIECVEGKYEITYPSFREYIEGLEEGRAKTCILEKAQGRTLEEIGTTFGITRERVRQIIVKTMEGRPRLKEDKYLYLFGKYDLDKEKVQQIFEFEPYSYEYYCMVTKKGGTRNYLEMMEEDLPAYIKKNLENYRYRDCLDIDGEKVEKNRNSILQYILRTRCRDEVTETQVRQYFDAFLKEYGLDGSDKFQYPERYFEMKLSTKPDVLWKHGKKLRYFVMSEEDFKELLEEIHFHDLKDVEISTKELFLAYPEIMKKYDLRDEYELHNLMKKHMPDSDIDFNRMPHIGIGNYK